jgi:hypothetical protein
MLPLVFALASAVYWASWRSSSSDRCSTCSCGQFAEQWYFPHKLPQQFGFTFWARVFQPTGECDCVACDEHLDCAADRGHSLAVAIPAGYALARLSFAGAA